MLYKTVLNRFTSKCLKSSFHHGNLLKCSTRSISAKSRDNETHVSVIGGGPAGFYTAIHLMKVIDVPFSYQCFILTKNVPICDEKSHTDIL